tara:strand:- start:442 stop:732 length:291 start_codon:yes stop_codon:yes gene_type:complete
MRFIFSLLLVSSLLYSCNKNNCSVKAEIRDLTGLDGCGFVIELENGDRVEPLNLSDYDVDIEDGNKIWVSYHATNSFIGSICMVGQIVEIDCVSNR